MTSDGFQKVEECGSVCKVRTQDAENFDEEVKSLVSAWRSVTSSSVKLSQPRVPSSLLPPRKRAGCGRELANEKGRER